MMRLVKSSQTNSQGLKANATYHEMCLFYADFKHFGLAGQIFPAAGNISSSIRANLRQS
jgi:hypothetical protein